MNLGLIKIPFRTIFRKKRRKRVTGYGVTQIVWFLSNGKCISKYKNGDGRYG